MKIDRKNQWIDLIIGDEGKFTIEERIFNTILFVSAIAAFFLFLTDIIQKLKPAIYLFSLGSTILLILFYLVARKRKISRLLAVPYSLFLILVFIYVWYNNGGIEGTSLYYLFPMVIIIPLFTKGRYRALVIILLILLGLSLLMIEINNPDLVSIIESDIIRKTDNFLSAIFVTFTILFAVLIIVRSYNLQHQKVISLSRSKDKMNSIIAHDLKNPVGTLHGLAKILKTRHNEMNSDQREKMIDVIVKSSEETYNLLENLLQWARSESDMFKISKEKINVSRQIFNTINLMSEVVRGKNQTVKTSIEKDIFIYADQNMLDTVFRNLLSNAIKFTPAGGLITISIKRLTNGNVTISFKDSGQGIDRENLDKLFNKDIIYTTHGTNKERGTGLGLMLCDEFVQKNNGSIDVNSTVNVGTEFMITFPKELN